jgi:hypothetical protein
VNGPLDFSLTGILVSLGAALADAGTSIALSSHDADTILVKDEALSRAVVALEAAGHRVREEPP